MTNVVFYFRGTKVICLINDTVESFCTIYTKVSGWLNILRLNNNTINLYNENNKEHSYILGVENNFLRKIENFETI